MYEWEDPDNGSWLGAAVVVLAFWGGLLAVLWVAL
jgi:hypothetical protein